MSIPKNEHLKIAIYFGSSLGAFKMAFETNSWRRQMYTMYFTVGLCYTTLFVLSSFVDLYILLSKSEINLEKVLQNICITLPITISILRVTAMRRPPVLKLIRKILDMENVIFGSSDEEIKNIYGAHVKRNRFMNIIYIISITCEGICYLNHFLYIEGVAKVDPITNTTITLKALPVSTWFPFDTQDHYALSYVLSGLYVAIGTNYFMFADMLSFGMMVFILGQIRILNHIFCNFSKYVCVVKEQFPCHREEASFLTMRECVLKHNEIILYIKSYNTSMRIITLLDFLQSSVHLASVVLQLLMSTTTVLNVFSYVGFACCMVLRLLLNYWCANEIMIESANISKAVYQSSWYDEPEKVKQMMRLVILRANKALGLQIGPFSTMTLSTFVGIIKTTYSYMMVVYG